MKQNQLFSFSLLNPKEKLNVFIFSCILIGISFSTTMATNGEFFLLQVSDKLLSVLKSITEIKSLAAATTTSHIPLISGSAQSIAETFNKISNYVILSNIFVLIQIVLLSLSQLLIIKICLIASLAASFIKKTHTLALRILIILLFINPGMPIYLNILNSISKHTQINMVETFKTELDKTHKEFSNKHIQQTQHESKLKKENLLEKAGEEIVDVAEKIGGHIIQDFKFFTDFTKNLGVAFLNKSIKLFVAHIVLFLLLPLLYIYIFLLLLHKLFNFSLNKKTIKFKHTLKKKADRNQTKYF